MRIAKIITGIILICVGCIIAKRGKNIIINGRR